MGEDVVEVAEDALGEGGADLVAALQLVLHGRHLDQVGLDLGLEHGLEGFGSLNKKGQKQNKS